MRSPKTNKYVEVAAVLRREVKTGKLRPGDRLPSFAAMRERFGAAQPTVERAHLLLEREGLITRRRGRGIYVAEPNRRDEFETSDKSWMSNAIAILAEVTGDFYTDHRQAGWAEFITRGAMKKIREEGCHAVVLHPDRLQGEELEHFVADTQQVIIVMDRLHAHEYPRMLKLVHALHRHGIQPVVYGDWPELALYDRVVSDHEQGAYELARWLVSQGHRRILNVWPQATAGYWFPARYAGYERALREAGLEPLPPLQVLSEHPEFRFDDVWQKDVRLLSGHLIEYLMGSEPVTAIMAHTDSAVPLVAQACMLFNKKASRDITLVGYDNYWRDLKLEDESFVPAASVDKRNMAIGQELVSLLLQRRAGTLPEEPQRHIVPARLVVMEPIS
jgi:GntR family transcriptional regulator, arabinose operon transcriptional repressor